MKCDHCLLNDGGIDALCYKHVAKTALLLGPILNVLVIMTDVFLSLSGALKTSQNPDVENGPVLK